MAPILSTHAMEITKTLYVKNRKDWRAWLSKHHNKETEIWLIYYRKSTGKPRIPYDDAVEEALCFGWIDSQEKGIDEEKFAQRFTPRKPKSPWSELNKERAKKLIKLGKMTKAGLEKFNQNEEKFIIPKDILKAIKADEKTWNNFKKFSQSYQRIRVGWIDGARKRPSEFKKRLDYFLKMTLLNKKFGMVQ